ncbi:unnamed protein product [Allacma fusca]|uniref:Carboxylic ester hydrolase n=1 Tax=Allacma fusca TaxID=39272 RepID=A0A8J2L3T7_9HEXA|nr:unnamed protein product [Allacma fusca]
MVLLGKFLLDLLCAYVSCAPVHPYPEIAPSSFRTNREIDLDGTNDVPVVLTPSGGLEGYTQTTSEGRKIYAFEGIPYAYPPVGNLRFRNPVPIKPWKGIKKATKTSSCIQVHVLHLFRTIGTEDCLHLNVYTPKNPSNSSSNGTLLPVVIAIHGGSFIFGSAAEMGPAYLLNQDIVLVEMNYRLGPLGFLSTGDQASPGNYGLKDQALAINWTMSNIEAFGGNASQILLIGYSAGAVSVHHQMIYNKEIRSALVGGISLSGTAFSHWAVHRPRDAKHLADRLGRMVKCPVQNSFKMIECLRNKSPYQLTYEQLNLMDVIPFPPLLFLPVIEPAGPDSFIPYMPSEAYSRGAVAQKPWITSMALNEGHTFLNVMKVMGQLGNTKRNFDKIMPALLNYRYLSTNHSKDLKEIGKKIKDFYLKDATNTHRITESGISEMTTDRFFTCGFEKSLRMHAKVAPSYGYIVTYKSRYNLGGVLRLREEEWGVGHSDDVAYFFNMSTYGPGFRHSDPEYKLSKLLINLVTNFAYTGVPTYTNPDNSDLNFWTPVSLAETETKILEINNNIKMISFPFRERAQFWSSLGLEDVQIMDSSDFIGNSTSNFEHWNGGQESRAGNL